LSKDNFIVLLDQMRERVNKNQKQKPKGYSRFGESLPNKAQISHSYTTKYYKCVFYLGCWDPNRNFKFENWKLFTL